MMTKFNFINWPSRALQSMYPTHKKYSRKSIKRLKKLREKFSRGAESAKDEKGMEIVKMMEHEQSKTPAPNVPKKFTGWFSDEFETDDFWKSKRRFSLQ